MARKAIDCSFKVRLKGFYGHNLTQYQRFLCTLGVRLLGRNAFEILRLIVYTSCSVWAHRWKQSKTRHVSVCEPNTTGMTCTSAVLARKVQLTMHVCLACFCLPPLVHRVQYHRKACIDILVPKQMGFM